MQIIRGKKGESVQHLVSGCEKLAQKEYKRQHNNVGKKVHWDLCKKNALEHFEVNLLCYQSKIL